MSDTPATPEQHRLVAEAIASRMKRDMQPQSDPDFDAKVADALAKLEQANA